MGEYLNKLRAQNKEKNKSPVYRTDVDSKFKIDPKQIRDTGNSFKPIKSTSTIKPKPIASKPLRANERMLYGEIEEEDEGTKYNSYRENLKSRAIQEDTAAEEIRTLRERVRKPPTNERAAQEQTLDMDRLRRLDMHQNPQKAEVLINTEGNGMYMPELTKDLDRKLENIGNTLRSGEEKGLYNIKEGLNQGLIQNWLSNEYYRQMNNLPNQVEKIEVFMKDHPELQESYSMEGKDNYWKRATRGIVKQAPMWVSAAEHGLGRGTLGAVTGAGAAALAGNASPLIIIPEEVITVPAAAMFGFRYGMSLGTTEYIAAQEAGQSYVELIMSGVSPEIARPIAETVGAVNGLLESAQIGSIGKSIPGVKQFADKFKKTAISEAAKRLIKIAGSYGYEVAENVVEEVLQSGTTIAGTELGKIIHQGQTGEQLQRTTWKEVAGELLKTGQSALIDFSLLPSVGFAKDLTSIGMDSAKAATIKKQELKVQASFKKAIYEDLPGSVKEFKNNLETIKEKDAVGMVILDKRLDQVLQKEGLKAEDKTQIETLKSEIASVVENVYAEAKKVAPEIKFADAMDRAGMVKEILAGKVDLGLSEIVLDDYKTAQKAKVVDEIYTMLQDGKMDTYEIGEAIEKKLPKSKRKPEIISAIINAVEKVSFEADSEILYSKVKNIQSVMKLLPQNDVVMAENGEILDNGIETSQDALGTIKASDDISTQDDALSQAKDKAEQEKLGKDKKDKSEKVKADKKAKEKSKTDKKTELSTDEYKNMVLSTEYGKSLVENVDKAKVFNEKVAKTNPVYKQFKDIVTAVKNNPIFNGLTFKFIDQDTKREWKRSELDEAGYKHLKEGWYEIAGQQENNSDTGRTATFYRNSTKDTFAEELIHDLQKRIFLLDPELETMIQEWEENVHAQAISEGYNIPDGYETFAQALVFSELGYAKANPELAELFSVPDEIVDRVNELLGSDLLAAITGTSKPELKKTIRMLSGKSKKVEGTYDPFDPDNYDYVEAEKAAERSHDIDFRASKSVGKKGTKAIIDLYPEFKPFYQQMANDIMADLTMTIPAEWTVTRTDLDTVLARNSRVTTKNIAFFKDVLKASYADILASLNRISEGKVKYALDRKIELVIDDNLTHGYENFFGDDIAANQDYLDLKYGKGETVVSNQLKDASESLPKGTVGKVSMNGIDGFIKPNGKLIFDGKEYSANEHFYIVGGKYYSEITPELTQIILSKHSQYLNRVIDTSKKIDRSHAGEIAKGFFGESYLDKSKRYEGLDTSLAEEIDKISSTHDEKKLLEYFVKKILDEDSRISLNSYLHIKIDNPSKVEKLAYKAYKSSGGSLGLSILQTFSDKSEMTRALAARDIPMPKEKEKTKLSIVPDDTSMQLKPWGDTQQEISSADTSINSNKLPATFNRVTFDPGTLNADIGGGRFNNATEFLATKDVTNVIFDPFNRTPDSNKAAIAMIRGGQADTATINNVLNVIGEQEARNQVILNAADAIKPEGIAYFLIYEGDGNGEGKKTSKGWQENRKTKSYVDEVSKYFKNVTTKSNLIVVKQPIKESYQLKEVKDGQSKQGDKYIFDSRGIVDRAKELAGRGRKVDFSKIPTVEYRLYARYGAFRIADYTKYVAHSDNITPSFRNGIMEAIEKAEAEGRHKPNTKVTFEEWFFREFEYDYSEMMFKERNSYPITTLANNKSISELEARDILIRREKDRYRYFHDKANSIDEGSFQLKSIETPEFKEWFKDSKVVDANGDPLVAYHGTTHAWTVFDNSRGNVENDLGKGFYATSDDYDANTNYLLEGQDLTNRIERAKEKFESEFDYDYDDYQKAEAIKAAYPEIEEEIEDIEVDEYDMVEVAELLAKKQIAGDTETVMPVYLKIENPIVLSKKGGTYFEFENEYDEDGEIIEEGGNAVDLYNSIIEIASEYNVDGASIWAELNDNIEIYDGINAFELVNEWKHLDRMMDIYEEESGDLAANQFIQDVFKNMGYDGIIYEDATDHFPRMSLTKGTKHFIAFKPTQIKSVENEGTFDPKNADIRYQLKTVATFYSTLQRTLDAKMPRRATAAQVMGIIKSNSVKADEIKWSGIEDFLVGKELVGKEELLQYLKDNDLKIEEHTKTNNMPDEFKTRAAEIYDLRDRGGRISHHEADRRIEELKGQFKIGEPKFQQYKLPGGENYREMLFTLPVKETKADQLRKELNDAENKPWEEQGFKSISEATDRAKEIRQELKGMEDRAATAPKYESSHWDESNVLAHTRLQDYTDAKGNKVLFVEEIQSDWHQAGRKKGYKDPGLREKILNFKNSLIEKYGASWYGSMSVDERNILLGLEREEPIGVVPDAPFQKTWHEFVLKRLIRYATDNGYDAVALTNGEQQNERYSLSKQVKAIEVAKKASKKYDVFYTSIEGGAPRALLVENATAETLVDYVGKDLAEKISQQTGLMKIYSGLDLDIGGEGMKGFYDKMIPTFLNKYLKKWGVKVEDIKFGVRDNTFKPDWYEVRDLTGEYSKMFDAKFSYERSIDGKVGIYFSTDKDSWEVYLDGEMVSEEMSREDAESAAISAVEDIAVDNENDMIQQGFYLNEEMKSSAVYEGQPLYQLKEVDYDFERLSFYNTVEMSPITDPGLRAELKNMAALYMVRHNKDTVNEGLTLLYDMGTEAAKMWIMGNQPASAEMNVVAMLLIKQASDNKDNDTAIELIDAIAKKAKTNGQATQILSMFGMITPQGIVRYAKKTYQKLLTEGQINEVNEVGNDLEQKLRKVNKKAAEDMDLTDAIKEIAGKTPEEMLSKRIMNSLKDKKHNEYNPIKLMVDTLFKVYKETVGLETEKPIDNTLTFIAHAITEREKYKEVWQQAKAIVKELTQDDPNAEAILDEYFDLMLMQTFPEGMMQKAVKTGLIELKVKIDQIVRQHYSEVNKVTDTLAQKLVAETGLSGYEAMMLEDYIKKTMATVTQEAKERILKQMSKDKSLTKRERKTLSERIIEMSNVGAFKNASFKGMIGAKLGYPAMTSELMTNLDYQAQRIQQMPEGHSKDVAVAKMLDTIAAGIPVKFWRKVNTLQTMAQLLNPKTIIRNIVGNTAFQAIDRMSRVTMIGLDVIASHFTGNRTKTFIGMTALKDREGGTLQKWGGYLGDLLMGEGFKEGWDLGLEDALNGIDTSGLTTQYDLPATRTFRAKEGKPVSTALATLETAMSIALRATDRAAFMASFTESLTEQMKIAKVTEATEYMVDVATVHGLYRTFQDANKVSTFFVQMKKTMNIVGTKDFGVGDLLLKYPKTPGNLLARSIDYSPLGIMAVAFKIFFDTSGKDAKGKTTAVLRNANSFKYASDNAKLDMQRAAVEGIGRAVTGTALITAGIVLAKAGILTGGDEDDWDVYYMELLAGLDQYQVNTSALLRFISSGFNAEAAARQKGDTLVSYDWMQPFATNLAVGADLALRIKSFMVVVGDDKENPIKVFDNKIDANNFVTENKSKGYKIVESTDGIGFLGSVISSIQVGSAALANQPLLQGISTLFGSRDIGAGAAEAIKSAPSGFMPTFFSQIAQLLDNEKKSTYDIKWFDGVARLVQRKVPGSSSLLEPNLDVFGEKQKYYDDDTNPIMAALYTFFSPAFVKKYNPSPEAEFILNLYDEYGDKRTVPTKVPKKVTVEGVTIKLTPSELTMIQEFSGKTIQERLSKEEALDTERLSEEAQIKRIDNIYGEVYNEVKEKLRKLRSIPKRKP